MAESTSCVASPELTLGVVRRRTLIWRLRAVIVPLLVAFFAAGLAYRFVGARSASRQASGDNPDVAIAFERASREQKPLLVVFTHPSAALAPRMAETVMALPVADFLRAHYVTLTLDSIVDAGRFRSWLGASGLLGSCVLDLDAQGRPDLLAVLLGFAEPDAYLQFLDEVSANVPTIRRLRGLTPTSVRARLELGELYRTSGNLAAARALFAAVTTPVDLRAQALEHLARLDVAEGRVAEARQTVMRARALQLELPSERLVFTESAVLSAERHVSEAVTTLERGLPSVSNPAERAQCLLLLADLEHELGRDAQALAHLKSLSEPEFQATWGRAAAERLSHILHPEPSHVH